MASITLVTITTLTLGADWTLADSWPLASTESYFTRDSSIRFVVNPPDDLENQPCTGTLSKRGENGKYQPLWKTNLVNDYSPVSAIISKYGQFVATFSDWGHVGYGPNVVAIYGPKGESIGTFSLEDIVPDENNRSFSQSISSRVWGRTGAHYFDVDSYELVLRIVANGKRFGQGDARFDEYRIGLLTQHITRPDDRNSCLVVSADLTQLIDTCAAKTILDVEFLHYKVPDTVYGPDFKNAYFTIDLDSDSGGEKHLRYITPSRDARRWAIVAESDSSSDILLRLDGDPDTYVVGSLRLAKVDSMYWSPDGTYLFIPFVQFDITHTRVIQIHESGPEIVTLAGVRRDIYGMRVCVAPKWDIANGMVSYTVCDIENDRYLTAELELTFGSPTRVSIQGTRFGGLDSGLEWEYLTVSGFFNPADPGHFLELCGSLQKWHLNDTDEFLDRYFKTTDYDPEVRVFTTLRGFLLGPLTGYVRGRRVHVFFPSEIVAMQLANDDDCEGEP